MRWKRHRIWFGVGLAALVAACSAANQARSSSSLIPQSYSQNGGTLTLSGTVTGVISSTEFGVNTFSGCGNMHVYTNSSTTITPAGAKAAAGEAVTASGPGSCATYLTATTVQFSATPAPTPTPPNATPSPFPAAFTIGHGEIFGQDDVFNPTDGDTSSGGQGLDVDGIPCQTTMPNTYHVHAFVGIIINGQQVALPDGTGMENPGADGTYNGAPNWTEYATCFYYLHTHDASGVIHIESPQSEPVTASLYTLGNYFDVWGWPLSSGEIGPYTGAVTAYVANVPAGTTQIPASAYAQYAGNPAGIPLYSHTSIWLEIGPTLYTPSQLPVLNYYMEY